MENNLFVSFHIPDTSFINVHLASMVTKERKNTTMCIPIYLTDSLTYFVYLTFSHANIDTDDGCAGEKHIIRFVFCMSQTQYIHIFNTH